MLQQAEDVRLGHAERPGQIGGDLRHLRRGHHHRVRVDQVGLHGDGQRLAVRGGDLAAHGRQAHGLQPLVLGDPHVRAGFKALELDQPPGEQGHHDRDAQQRGPQPPPRIGPRPQHPADHGARGRGGRGRGGRAPGLPVREARAARLRGREAAAREVGVTAPRGRALAPDPVFRSSPGAPGPAHRARCGPGARRPVPAPPRDSRPPPRGSRPPPRTVMGYSRVPVSRRHRSRRRWRAGRSSR